MSDYGFATYDDKSGKKRLGSVNSKWPIFGPKYANIDKCFKTIHISETYMPNYKTADLPQPVIPSGSYYAYNDYRWHEKQLIYQYEHGYDFRPVGYAVFSGDMTVNVNFRWYGYTGYPYFAKCQDANGSILCYYSL